MLKRLNKVFLLILIFLMIVNKSIANISNCTFFDTVDLSGIKKKNHEYEYGVMKIPFNQTGKYSYLKLVNGSTVSTKRHRRACVCKNKSCIRFCCPQENKWRPGICTDSLQNEYFKMEPIMNITFKDQIILRDYTCEDLNIQWYTFFEDETFLLQAFDWSSNKEFQIFKHSSKLVPAVREIGEISLLCYILTMAVYLYVKKLQNLGGKCFTCCLFCMFMKCFFWVLNSWNLLKNIHSVAGYTTYFFWMASFLWFFVLNHVFWESFGGDKTKPPRFCFQTYSIFVWTSAAVLTILIYPVNSFLKIGTQNMCRYFVILEDWNWLPGIYYGPMLFLSICSMIFTIRTGRTIRKQLKDLKKCNPLVDVTSSLMWLRLCTILGVTWSLDLIICTMQTYRFWPQVLWLGDYYHAAFGIPIFVLLILKSSTFQLLKKGNGDKNQQKHPEANIADTAC
nr:probable G-protein coupled receptor Mth-like 6 [Drosophila suzukii]